MKKILQYCRMVEIAPELDRIRTSRTTSLSGKDPVEVWNYFIAEKERGYSWTTGKRCDHRGDDGRCLGHYVDNPVNF